MRRLVGAAVLLVAIASRAEELSDADRVRLLWSPRLAWTEGGLPLVTVRVAEGASAVELGGRLPNGGSSVVRTVSHGEGGAELGRSLRWRVRAESVRPAKLRWYVVVTQGTPADGARLKEEELRWRARGFRAQTLEAGTLFAIHGAVVDDRRLLLAVAYAESEAAARDRARQLTERYRSRVWVHAEVAERAMATLVADDGRRRVTREGALWFAAEEGLIATTVGSESHAYAGQLLVTVDRQGKLAVVNAVAEEQLLAGLLPAEIGATAPVEALKAQAVAARTELFIKMGTRHATEPYRLCAKTHCQVYAGASVYDPRVAEAIQATRGELLVSKSGRLVDAVYSASCGGHTEDNDRAWGGGADTALRGRLDAGGEKARRLGQFERVNDVASFLAPLAAKPFCASAASGAPFRWTAEVPIATVEEQSGVKGITDVAVLERGVSGRVVRLQIVGERGAREVRGELEVRRALGGLKSALFTLSLVRDRAGKLQALTFLGGGSGHGVGLCQTGAIGMAEQGKKYREILEHYYREAAVKKFY